MATRLTKVNGGDLWYVEELSTYRQKAKLTQQGLAESTREFDPQGRGVSKETISKMERRYGVSHIKARVVYETLASKISDLPADAVILTTSPLGGASGQAVGDE